MRAVWLGAACAVLGWALIAFDGTPNWDGEVLLVYIMLALGFPGSLAGLVLIAAIYRALEASFGTAIPSSRLEIIFAWGVFAIVGYLQWFAVGPALVRWFHRAKAE